MFGIHGLVTGAVESPPETAASFTTGHSSSVRPAQPLQQQTSTGQQQQQQQETVATAQPSPPLSLVSMNGNHTKQQLENLSEAKDAAEMGGGGPGVSAAGFPSQQWQLPSSNNNSSSCCNPHAAMSRSASPFLGSEVQLTPRPPSRRGSGGSVGGVDSCSPSLPCAPPSLGQPVLPQLVMPLVTIVFVCVEGAAALKRRRSTCREIHQLLLTAMRDVLRFVAGGGYWCQHWAGDLKYMLAFSSPRAALEWCLLVQELTMYLPWSQQVLMAKGCMVEYDLRGKLVFRGPRLKMGVCEGAPQKVMPDHLGRADYYGPSVNQAARYMDAAAHGGQVVADVGLMKGVVKEWQEAAAARVRLQQQQELWQQQAQAVVQATAETLAAAGLEVGDGEQGVSSEVDVGSIVAEAPTTAQQQEVEDELKVYSSPELSDLPSSRKQWQPAPSKLRSSLSVSLPWSGARVSAAAAEGTADEPLQFPAASGPPWRPAASKQQQQQQFSLRSRYVVADVHTRSTLVTLHWCGMFYFKGTPEPVPMVRAECGALSGRIFASEPPRGKGSCQRVLSGIVEEAQGVLLADLTGEHRGSLAVELVSSTAKGSSWPAGLQVRPKSVASAPSQGDAAAALAASGDPKGCPAGAAAMAGPAVAMTTPGAGEAEEGSLMDDDGNGSAPPTPRQ